MSYEKLDNGLYKRIYSKKELLESIGKKKLEIEGLKEVNENSINAEKDLEKLKTKYKEK